MHKIGLIFKKVVQQVNVNVLFSAPQKLSILCKKVCPKVRTNHGCTIKHTNKFRIVFAMYFAGYPYPVENIALAKLVIAEARG